jgi:NAD(P)H-flavin reductase
MAVQVQGEVLSIRRVGAYNAMTVVAPGIAELTRPGHFVAVQVGGPESSMLLRRAFAIYDVKERGRVSDVLPEVLDRTGSEVIYACGPMAMLKSVSAIAAERGIPCQVAVEESMACGIGVCMTCVLPVIGDDGVSRMVRSCVEGPVFLGDRVRWDDVGTVPSDVLGAPVPVASTGGGN